MTTDSSGAIYLVGATETDDFPHTQAIGSGGSLTFVVKLSPDGQTRLYSTLISGFVGRGIAVDSQSNIYLTGVIFGPFLLGSGSAQAQFGGGTDAVVMKLSADGSRLVYSTYLGGSGNEITRSIAVDDEGSAYVTGNTTSRDFPATAGALQTRASSRANGFVAKLSPDGTAFVFASYFGGTNSESANSIFVDSQHRVYLTGQTKSPAWVNGPEPHLFGPADSKAYPEEQGNAFVARLNAIGSSVDYLTFLRGSENDAGVAITVDKDGRAVVLGSTSSPDFPVTPGVFGPTFSGWQDFFVARLAPDGATPDFVTYLGTGGYEGFGGDYWTGDLPYGSVGLDPTGNIYFEGNSSGRSGSNAISLETEFLSGVTGKLRADGTTLEWYRFLSGSEYNAAYGLVVNSNGVWVAGVDDRSTQLPGFPMVPPAWAQRGYGGGESDAFLVRLSETDIVAANASFESATQLVGSPQSVPFTTLGANNDSAGRALWWSWTAPASGVLTLQLDQTRSDALSIPFLGVYTGSSLQLLLPVITNLTCVTCPILGKIHFGVQAGQTYQIALGAMNGDMAEGILSLELSSPANDDFARAAVIGDPFPTFVQGQNAFATTEQDENALNGWPGRPGYGHSVWWQWVSPVNATVTISVETSDFDARVQAYIGDELSQLDAVTSVPLSQITFDADLGNTYRIAVFGWFDAVGQIDLSIEKAAPPVNDDFDQATQLIANDPPIPISNRNATPDPGEPPLFSASNGFHSLWWKWSAPSRGYAQLSMSNSQSPPGLGIFTGTSLSKLDLFKKDISPGAWGSAHSIQFAVPEGATYYILVNDQAGDPGSVISVSLQFRPYLILPDSIRISGTTLSFSAAGEAGVSYQIEQSTDLIAWTPSNAGAFVGPDFLFQTVFSTTQTFFRMTPK